MDGEARADSETNKVLSQREIDLLLGALGDQDTQETFQAPDSARNVRPYDFRRPDKFSKEHIRALQIIHESFAREATSSLSTSLRTNVQVKLSSVEQAVYDEYIEQLPNPTVIGIVDAEPLPGRMILEINFALASALVDRLLGGVGRAVRKSQEVTDIEFTLLQTLIRNLLSSLGMSWLQLGAAALNLNDLVFNPQIVKAALHGDIGILIVLELRMSDTSHTISMFIPYTMLEPIMGKLTSQVWFAGSQKSVVSAHDDTRPQLENVRIPITVNLGTTFVSIRELLGLQKGNVIRLGTSTNQELEVIVGGKHKFWSRPGRVGSALAVAITRPAREEFQNGLRNSIELPEASVVGAEG